MCIQYWERQRSEATESKGSRRTSFGPSGGRIQGQQPLVCFLASVLCQMTKNAKNPSQYCGPKTTNRTINNQRGKRFFASFLSRKRKNRLQPTIQKQSIGQVTTNAVYFLFLFAETERPDGLFVPQLGRREKSVRRPSVFFCLEASCPFFPLFFEEGADAERSGRTKHSPP